MQKTNLDIWEGPQSGSECFYSNVVKTTSHVNLLINISGYIWSGDWLPMLFLILFFYLVLFFYFYDLIHIPYRLKFRGNKFLPMIIFVIKTKSYRFKKFSPRMYFNIVTAYLCLNFPLFSELLVLSIFLCYMHFSCIVLKHFFRSATIFLSQCDNLR